MPILPLVDLLILMGWSSLMFGFIQKAIWISTSYRPMPFGLTPTDFLIIAGICLLFALALAARTWVKLNEPRLAEAQREMARIRARRARAEAALAAADGEDLDEVPAAAVAASARPKNS